MSVTMTALRTVCRTRRSSGFAARSGVLDEPTDGMRGFWSVTRHADIIAANGASIFSSAQGIRIEANARGISGAAHFSGNRSARARITRKMVNPAFSRPAMQTYETMVREMAAEVLDKALAHAEIDGVETIAKHCRC